MTTHDWLILLRDCIKGLTWFVAAVFFLSGCQDFIYDIGAYSLRLFRRFWYRKRPRLTLARLRSREQQRIAVIVPAWNEGEVVGSMVDNIIRRVEYRNYMIFVGVYPNDPATNNAVDRLAAVHPQIVKVVNTKPGPTTKADCLNNVYRTLKAFEDREGLNFDVIVMHDAEDVVHPNSFLVYNYLIPRVDAIQLPILPLPTDWRRFVHWSYADEFSETHMKDVPVREKLSGFVPYAGTGTGFSRRVFVTLEQMGFTVFNETSMTEDYSMSKRIRELGMTSIFVNLVLGDDTSPWWTPLSKRSSFIANWAFFPMDFSRAVRQKTRWILGISLQEWEHGGWKGTLRIKENLIKDRKVFVAAGTSLLGYVVLAYFILYGLQDRGFFNWGLQQVLEPNSSLPYLVAADTFFMLVRMFQRIVFVTLVYGFSAGLLAILRLPVGNVINGLAAFRALQAFALARQGKAAVRWDNTTHVEGVGELPTAATERRTRRPGSTRTLPDLLGAMNSPDPHEVVEALNNVPRDLIDRDRTDVVRAVAGVTRNPDSTVRSALARALGFLQWQELIPWLYTLLKDGDWLVRANAAKALMKQDSFETLLEHTFFEGDRYACDVLVRTLEQDAARQQLLWPMLESPNLRNTKAAITKDSRLLRARYDAWLSQEQIA